MFHRIQLDAWLHQCPRIAMMIFVGVFVVSLVRILLIPKKRVEYMEHLPLEEKETPHYEI